MDVIPGQRRKRLFASGHAPTRLELDLQRLPWPPLDGLADLRGLPVVELVGGYGHEVVLNVDSADLGQADVSQAHLVDSTWRAVVAQNLRLSHAHSRGTAFVDCRFYKLAAREATFGLGSPVTVDGCLFGESDLRDSLFAGCSIAGTRFEQCKLGAAIFEGCKFRDVAISGKVTDVTIRRDPSPVRARDHGVVSLGQDSPEIDITDADASYVAFSGGLRLNQVKIGTSPGRRIVTDWQDRLARAAHSLQGDTDNNLAVKLIERWRSDPLQDEYLLIEKDVIEHCSDRVADRLFAAIGV